MPNLLKTLSAVALLALSGPAWAQEEDGAEEPSTQQSAPAGDEAETDTAPDAAPSGEEDGAEGEAQTDLVEPSGTDNLSMGEPANEGDQPGSTYVEGEFDAWEQRCVRTEDGTDPCQLYQLLRDQEGNAVAEMSVFPLPAGREAAAGSTIITPLETLLTRNIRLSVDGGQAKRYPFDFCAQQGCFARIGLTQAEVQQFRRGAEAQLTIVPAAAPDQEINLVISLSGFTAGYDAVAEANAR